MAENGEEEPGTTAVATPKPTGGRAKKHPCRRCLKSVSGGKSIFCQMCEFWHHYDCVPNMTKEWYDNIKMTYKTIGFLAFMCHICKKATQKLNKAMKDME